MELYLEIIRFILELLIYALISFSMAWYFYSYKRKDLPGKMVGSSFVAFIGAIIITMLSSSWFIPVMNWLMNPRIGENFIVRVNILTATLGAFLFLWLYNFVNHDRMRK